MQKNLRLTDFLKKSLFIPILIKWTRMRTPLLWWLFIQQKDWNLQMFSQWEWKTGFSLAEDALTVKKSLKKKGVLHMLQLQEQKSVCF